ncbi:nitrogenase iron-molybdenum cofactor biosynthesis protein NifE [Spirochaeta thermophila DSM 6192]|uniref:Nitrogenase iron-molybdenum cofactor biosynthesis protein NifE n=1 Tax=Winmispira thermophila (strain ATCC 49972 / DSM 6192 / RI 19.B1) TaxID=665571 RepID=E0RPC7_WINT6|nr:nitrogenase iron-molybdenum cofactor biosynthesis protein NifE [Spirochaeta thermophila DSM 6192]
MPQGGTRERNTGLSRALGGIQGHQERWIPGRLRCALQDRLLGGERPTLPCSINIIGEFNIAGETWLIRRYYEEMGIRVVSTITGDSSIEEIAQAGSAALNVVQCSGSTTLLAKKMEERYAIPFIRVSYFGVEDTAEALYQVARFFEPSAPGMLTRTRELVASKVSEVYAELERYRRDLEGSRAAIYVGGAFKAFSLIKALRLLGISTPVVGSQTGSREDYETIAGICEEGTVILDDSNPAELAHFLKEKDVHLLIGGVKERPLSYKLGVAFCDHNHERKLPLAGFEGMVNFAREVHASLMSPVWRLFREGVDHGSVL